MLTYKMAFLSPMCTSKVISRVVPDVVTSPRPTRLSNICLIVAANRDLSSVLRGIAKVKTTTDVSACEIYRLYVDNSVPNADDVDPNSVVPDYVVDFDTIEVVPKPRGSQLVIEGDPYAGMDVPDRWTNIPSTIDLMRRAPKPLVEDDPPYNPYR